jgi:hypothetical protein
VPPAPAQHLQHLQHLFSTCSAPTGVEALIEMEKKLEVKVTNIGESHTILIQFFWLKHSYFEKITIFYKTWLKVFGVEESIGTISFRKFWDQFFHCGNAYFEKITIFYKNLTEGFRGRGIDWDHQLSKILKSPSSLLQNWWSQSIPLSRKPSVKFYKKIVIFSK